MRLGDMAELVLRGILLGILLLPVPVLAGSLLDGLSPAGEKKAARLLFRWIGGQLLLWAGFQIICVPMILTKRLFSEVVLLYGVYIIALCAVAAGLRLRKKYSGRGAFHVVHDGKGSAGKPERKKLALWAVFWLLLAFQLVQSLRLTYADGDDTYYVAISTITVEGNRMYQDLPYTGGSTALDVRHGLAPFPLWISFLSRVSGVRAVSVAHVAVPFWLIGMTYGIYGLFGAALFKGGEKLPLFLIFTEILVLFGNYSIYSAENFLIARSRQGKAALGNIVVPMLFLLLFTLAEKLQQNKPVPRRYWVLLAAVMLTACLCSTMGAALSALLLAVAGLSIAMAYRRWRVLLGFGASCVPCAVFLMLYLILR